MDYEGREQWVVPIIRGRLLDMGGDEALFYLAYDSMLVVASMHDPSLVLLCTRRCYTSAESHDVSRLDVFPPPDVSSHSRARAPGASAAGGADAPHPPGAAHGDASDTESGDYGEGSGGEGGGGIAAGMAGTVLVGGGGLDVGGHWDGAGMAEDAMMAAHGLHGFDAAHAMLGLPGEPPRVAMSGKAVVCAELADSSLVSLRVWFGSGPVPSKATERARCKLAVQRLLVRDAGRTACALSQEREQALVQDAALDYFFMLLAVTLLRIEEDSCKGHEEPLATALAPGAERPDHAPTAGDAALQGGGEEGLAGMRLEEMRVCLEVARVRRGCGNKEVRADAR